MNHFFLYSLYLIFFVGLDVAIAQDNGLAPEVTDLNAEDISYTLEKKMPYLERAFISRNPRDRKDGLATGKIGIDGGDEKLVLEFARSLAKPSENPKVGKTDSFLIAYKGKLVFESYFRRGRANYPHYQMSITKSYTAMAIGRAIQLGHLSMDDLKKPVVNFLKQLDQDKLVEGADRITLHQAMQMGSGIRVAPETIKQLKKHPQKLLGQGQIQAYLENTAPITPFPREFKYQAADTSIAMQVLEAVVPATAEEFIRKQLWGSLGVTNYRWQEDTSGLPKAAAGSSVRSRDMLKMGMLILQQGQWQGKQIIPAEFVKVATSSLRPSYGNNHYGYFWWSNDFTDKAGKKWRAIQGRGAGGQFIYIIPEIELIAVVTSHNKGMGDMLEKLPRKLIPAFTE